MYFNFTERVFFKFTTAVLNGLVELISSFPFFRFIKETKNTQTPITFSIWFRQRVLGKNRNAYWPVSPYSSVVNPKNVYAGIETSPGLMPGCYIQALGKIYVGDYTQVAPNVGIISSNHDLYDNAKHNVKEVRIGRYCWLGMGSVILPGVTLGDFTIVAAGSIVTKSFNDGYCVIGGNPARIIKTLDKSKCVYHKSKFEYNGYIPSSKFQKFRERFLYV